MIPAALPSSAVRFLRKFGFALFQAALVGALFGALVYFRVPRAERAHLHGGERPLHERILGLVERLELWLYDWRIRELGRASQASEQVVLVAIDDHTLASARQSDHPEMAMHPWPRELLGGLTERVVAEGATHAVVDLLFPDASPRGCSEPGASAQPSDDEVFRARLDRLGFKATLAFTWNEEHRPRTSLFRPPHLLLVGEAPSAARARDRVREILAQRKPAFVVPEGSKVSIFAGVGTHGEGEQLARRFGVPPPARIRPLTSSDWDHQISPTQLLVSLAEVELVGLSPERLFKVRTLEHPTAALLGEKSAYGSVALLPDVDGKVRAIPHLVRYVSENGATHVLPSAPLAAVLAAQATRVVRYAAGRLHVGPTISVPIDEEGFSLLRFDAAEASRGGRGSLKRSVQAFRVLVNLFDRQKGVPQHYDNELKERVAVVTDTSRYATYVQETPIGEKVSRGAILGQSIQSLLHSQGVRRVKPSFDLFATCAMALLGALLAVSLSQSFRSFSGAIVYFGSAAVACALYLLFTRSLFVRDGLWVAAAAPLLALSSSFLITTLYAFRTELEIRDFVTSALGRYVSPEVARQVTRNLALMRPERRQMTVYFSDIEGFGQLTEQLPPEKLVSLLNAYLTEMTSLVRTFGGQIDKYIGDAVMAFWGAPVRSDRHAEDACESALEMRDLLGRRQAEWEKLFGRKLVVRAGINTGDLLVGDMGSEHKSNYTVLGDAVGLASRLERSNRLYGTFVLVGELTAQLCSHAFVFREVDRLKTSPTGATQRIFELVGRKGEVAEKHRLMITAFEQALLAYRDRRFADALDQFRKLVEAHQDPVAKVYVKRCEELVLAPPPEGWQGVYERREQ